MANGVYAARMDAVSISTAITILQVTAPSTATVEIERAWIGASTTTSAAQQISILRKTGAATVTAFTPVALRGDAAAGSTAGNNASAEGTDGTVLIRDIFNVLNGWLYLPVPEERIQVPPSGIIALKFPVAPGAATTFTAGIVFREIG